MEAKNLNLMNFKLKIFQWLLHAAKLCKLKEKNNFNH